MALLRVVGEELHREADEARCGLVAGAGNHAGVGDHFVARERTPRAVGFVDLGVQQLGHEVVGWVPRAPVDVVGEHRQDVVERGLVERDRRAIGAECLVGSLAVGELIGLGDAEQEPDGPQRNLHTELADDVELVPSDQRVQRANAVAADEGFEIEHASRREHACEQGSVRIVDGRILEEEDPWWDLDAGADDLQDRAAAGAVCVPVEKRGLDVVPPAQRVEVERLVPVQRRFVPEPAPGRVRIIVDVHVVGVVVDSCSGGCRGHALSFDRSGQGPR